MKREVKKPQETADFNQALAVVQQQGGQALAWKNFNKPLETTPEVEGAGNARKALKQVIEALETKRKEYTAPLDQTKKALMRDAKAAQEPFAAVLGHVERLLLDYDDEQRRQKVKEAEAVAKKAERRGEHDYAVALVTTAAQSRVDVPSVQTALTWKGRVMNLPELLIAISKGIAPENLVEINYVVLNKLARAYEKTLATHVPGTEGYQEAHLRSK